jgi:hypothetical protein
MVKLEVLGEINKFHVILIALALIMLFTWFFFEYLTPLQIIETPKAPSKCVLAPGIPCLGQEISESDSMGHGVLRFIALNDLGKRANFYFNATYIRDDISTDCVIAPTNGAYIRPGTSMHVSCFFDKPFFTQSETAEFTISGRTNYSTKPFDGTIYGVIIK